MTAHAFSTICALCPHYLQSFSKAQRSRRYAYADTIRDISFRSISLQLRVRPSSRTYLYDRVSHTDVSCAMTLQYAILRNIFLRGSDEKRERMTRESNGKFRKCDPISLPTARSSRWWCAIISSDKITEHSQAAASHRTIRQHSGAQYT